jgi:ribulose-5-phosphate 4-epimerase/fuculose-1-phosphate aldolase
MRSDAEHLILAARHLAARGLSPGSSGNLSVRAGDRILVTPTGSSLSRVEAGDLAEVLIADGTVLSGRPSKEYPLHLAVYRQRPAATAVVHLHSPYATAIACLSPDAAGHAPLPPLTPYRVMRLGEVPVAEFAAPGSRELAAGVEALAAASPVILLAQHGPVVAGDTLDAAVDLAEELETAAQLTLLLDGRSPRLLSPAEVAALLPPS